MKATSGITTSTEPVLCDTCNHVSDQRVASETVTLTMTREEAEAFIWWKATFVGGRGPVRHLLDDMSDTLRGGLSLRLSWVTRTPMPQYLHAKGVATPGVHVNVPAS